MTTGHFDVFPDCLNGCVGVFGIVDAGDQG